MAARKPAASLVRARVLANADPAGQGRVQVQAPGLGPAYAALWADVLRPALWPAGWPPPEPPPVGSEVLLAWAGAAPGQPVVVGAVGPATAADAAALHLSVQGPLSIDAAQVTLNAGTVQASGVLRCDTLIANTVVAASYTPGAGNLV